MRILQEQLQNSFTQEFTFKGKQAVGGFWHWTLGAFFSQQWLKTNGPVFFDEAMTAPIGNAIQRQMYNAMVQAMAGKMIAQGMPTAAAQAAAQRAIEQAGGVGMEVSMGAPGLYIRLSPISVSITRVFSIYLLRFPLPWVCDTDYMLTSIHSGVTCLYEYEGECDGQGEHQYFAQYARWSHA